MKKTDKGKANGRGAASAGGKSTEPERGKVERREPEATPAKKARATVADKAGREWKEGSNAQDIFLLIKGAGKRGITVEDAIVAAKRAKVKSVNVEGRVRLIFGEAVQRGLAVRDGELFKVA